MSDKEKLKVVVFGDGKHDDTEALEMIFNGKATGVMRDGREFNGMNMPKGEFLTTRTIVIKEPIV